MKLTLNHYYDDQNGEYIASKYYIDGEEYSFEEYCEMLEELELDDECDEFEDDDLGCDCINCTLDYYSEQIQEMTGGCFGCIREVLGFFLEDIIEHIVIENG